MFQTVVLAEGWLHVVFYDAHHGLRCSGTVVYNLPKILSITQFTGVALMLVDWHTPMPCKSSMTDWIMGSCTYGGLGTVIEVVPSLVIRSMGP